MTALGFEQPGPGETWPFCKTLNPGLIAAKTRVSGLCFSAALNGFSEINKRKVLEMLAQRKARKVGIVQS